MSILSDTQGVRPWMPSLLGHWRVSIATDSTAKSAAAVKRPTCLARTINKRNHSNIVVVHGRGPR